MKDRGELKDLSIDKLNEELLSLRKQQFNMRLKRSAGLLDKTHTIAVLRKSIARVKTIMTQKLDGRDKNE